MSRRTSNLYMRHSLLFCLAVSCISFNVTVAQKIDKKAFDLLETAMAPLEKAEASAVFFEGISFGLASPKEIFSVPVYKIYRGGYMYHDGNKFEVQLGVMKALCDGKVMVVVDEPSRSMVIDSVRTGITGLADNAPDIEKIFSDQVGEADLAYEGTEMVNGKSCYKVRSVFKDDAHVIYYIEEKTGNLLLISEYQQGKYDCYWIRKMGKAPENNKYLVNIPKKETEKLYGYDVYDFRFVSEDLKAQNH